MTQLGINQSHFLLFEVWLLSWAHGVSIFELGSSRYIYLNFRFTNDLGHTRIFGLS